MQRRSPTVRIWDGRNQTNETRMMKRLNIVCIIILLWAGSNICISCNDDDDDVKKSPCNEDILISQNQFDHGPNDDLTIMEVTILDDCLNIKFGAGGCDGTSWIFELVDSGEVLDSSPPQRNLRLSLEDNEDCEAFIIKETSFDLTPLQVDGQEVILNLTRWDGQINYRYE